MLSFKSSLWILSAILGSASSQYSEWECRPLDAGPCTAPHPEPSGCDGTPACCPSSIITDWRTKKMTCKHGDITSLTSNPMTNPPTNPPTAAPTVAPLPTLPPTNVPATGAPTVSPTPMPAFTQSTNPPTRYPTRSPTPRPTPAPTGNATTLRPTPVPTGNATTLRPTPAPTGNATTLRPTPAPTANVTSTGIGVNATAGVGVNATAGVGVNASNITKSTESETDIEALIMSSSVRTNPFSVIVATALAATAVVGWN